MQKLTLAIILLIGFKAYSQNFKFRFSGANAKEFHKLKLLSIDEDKFITCDLKSYHIPDRRTDDQFETWTTPFTTLRKYNFIGLTEFKQANINPLSIQKNQNATAKLVSINNTNLVFVSYLDEEEKAVQIYGYTLDENLQPNSSPKLITTGKPVYVLSEDKSQLLIVSETKDEMKYVILDEKLNVIKKAQIVTGYESYRLYKKIKFTKDYIYILGQDLKEGTKQVAKHECNKLFCIDVKTGKFSEQPIITDIANIVQAEIIFSPSLDRVIIGGLLSDKKNKTYNSNKRNIIHGVFYSEFDKELKSKIGGQFKELDDELKGFCGNWNYSLKSLKILENNLVFISEQENLNATGYNGAGSYDDNSGGSAIVTGHIFLCSFKLTEINNNLWSFRIKKMSSETNDYGSNYNTQFHSFIGLNNNKSLFLIFNSNPDITQLKIDTAINEIKLNTKNTIPICLELNSKNEVKFNKVFDEEHNNKKFNIQTNNQLNVKENECLFMIDNGSQRQMGHLIIE